MVCPIHYKLHLMSGIVTEISYFCIIYMKETEGLLLIKY
uniref:Uncharacterized protein n=1 Tax=Lepeophtheirus salmonis TaxID=72036 RepID=A0A0K2VF43_LEPSM